MVDNVETGRQAPGTPGAPSQPVSGTQPPQTSAIDVEALWPSLEAKVTDVITRSLQSSKDKRIAKLQGDVDTFRDDLARMKKWQAMGKSEDEAILMMRLEDSLPKPVQPDQQPASPTPQAGSRGQVSAFYVPVLEALGLEPNSAEVSEVLRSTQDVTEQMAKFADIAKRKKEAAQKVNPPNPATVMPTGGGSGIDPGDTLESVEAELDRMRALPMAKRDMKKFRELNEKQAAFLKHRQR